MIDDRIDDRLIDDSIDDGSRKLSNSRPINDVHDDDSHDVNHSISNRKSTVSSKVIGSEGREEDLNADAEIEDFNVEDLASPSDMDMQKTDMRRSDHKKTVQFKLSKSGSGSVKSNKITNLVSAKQPTMQASLARGMAEDSEPIPQSQAGQSNAFKKSKVPVKVKFEDEASSESKASGSSRSSYLRSISGSLNSKIIEEKAQAEYGRFFPVFKEVYKLRALQSKGYKAKPQDFFAAYLEGMRKADMQREEEQKAKNMEFFQSVRKIMEQQEKRTKELLERIEERQIERQEEVEERIAKVGQFMVQDYKVTKEETKLRAQKKKAEANENFKHLQKLGLAQNPMMQNAYLK